MSTKTLIAFATALFTTSFVFAATAEAGCRGKHFGFSKPYSTSQSYKAKKRAKARAKARARARLAAKKRAKAKALRLAKAKKKAKAKRIANANVENSFVAAPSTATALLNEGEVQKDKKDTKPLQQIAVSTADATTTVLADGTQEAGCKRFVPAVGRTITVSCE